MKCATCDGLDVDELVRELVLHGGIVLCPEHASVMETVIEEAGRAE